MARIRTIKPSFWTDEAVGECSPTARLLFIGTWNYADDYGNLERSSKQLKAQIFPFDSIDVEPLVVELIEHGLLIEYGLTNKKYLHIKGFESHQKVEKKSTARFPLHDSQVILPDPSPTSSGSSLGMEGNGKDKEKIGASRSRAPPATRIPDDFALTAERRSVALTENLTDPERIFAGFCDYWRAAAGQRARKHDWDATWRNWCRNQNGNSKQAAPERLSTVERVRRATGITL